ncbi:MAG TPA: hypothetical protein VFN55_06400 [Solirubrobacteraceae bacterium]|nr:hypothetical protein [Solirubrobacteraceae bacterium]
MTLLILAACALITAAGGAIATGRAAISHRAAVSVTATRSPLIVGLADGAAGYGGASTGPRLDLMRRVSGARWFRDQFWWYKIEPRPGRFDFRYYDHYMLAVGRRGLHVVAQLEGSPKWSASSVWAVPANPAAYARYVAAVLHRYGSGGTFWKAHPGLAGSAITAVELWNEPYFPNGNAGHYDPARYARLVRASYRAAHRVDRSAKILLEADMATHQYGPETFRWWVDSLYRAMPSLNRYFDGVAMHDYGSDAVHLTPMRFGQAYRNWDRTRRIEDVRALFVHHHAARKPFWITELGFTTCHLRNVDCLSPAAQAADLQTMFGYITGRYRSWVRSVFVFRFQDAGHGTGFYDSYGLVRVNGTPKPALSVFRPFALASG